jgi:hypothetical protein
MSASLSVSINLCSGIAEIYRVKVMAADMQIIIFALHLKQLCMLHDQTERQQHLVSGVKHASSVVENISLQICWRYKKMSRYPSAHGHTPSYRSLGSMPVYPSALGPRDYEFEVRNDQDNIPSFSLPSEAVSRPSTVHSQVWDNVYRLHPPSYRSLGSMPVYPSALGPRDYEFEVWMIVTIPHPSALWAWQAKP